ncbi:MAG: NADH-quinone oxidoreductase subunit C [Bacteroidetes bacterium]|nr:NADH-quinone oxidoreductase subunit C [Bacteroidota bacterium]
MNNKLLEALQGNFPGKILQAETPYGFLTIEIPPADNVEIVSWLQNHEKWDMNFMTDLCGIHYPENEGKEIGVVYHLHSFKNNLRMRIKAFMPKDKAEIQTMTGLFAAANWMERETYDFYGIQFTGHPDLRRILNVDNMDYFPMLKEYALEDETRTDKTDKFFGR